MKILLGGRYTPKGTFPYYEKAFSKFGTVAYCGLPYKMERAGYAPNINLSEDIPDNNWDIFFYIEEWNQGFPVGIEELPFPTAVYLPDAGYDLKNSLNMALFFDYVFLAQQWLIEKFQRVNKNTFYLPFACDPERVNGPSIGEKIYDIVFVGALYKDRKRILNALAKHFKMNDYTVNSNQLSLEDITQIHLSSKIVFNKLPLGYEDYNLRVFDVLCCGSLLLTDIPQKHREPLFRHGEHLASYKPEDNIVSIIKYYLNNDREREEISRKGREFVLEKHTYEHRVKTVFETIKAKNFRTEAPLRRETEGKIFLCYEKVFSKKIMINSMAKMFSQANVSFLYKIKSLGYVFYAVLKRLRQMGWKNLFKRGEKTK